MKTKRLNVEYILGILLEQMETIDGVEIYLRSLNGTLVLFSDGELLRCSPEREGYILEAGEVELCIDLSEGNFSSIAYGCI